MPSIFTKIINGEIPSYKLYEDDDYIAILDIEPFQPGHTLIIPKLEIDLIYDLPDEIYDGLFRLAKQKLAPAIQQAIGCQRVGMIVEGLDVPHTHLHLVPINGSGDLRQPGQKLPEEQMTEIAERIRQYI